MQVTVCTNKLDIFLQTSTLIEKIHNCNSLEGYTDAKQKLLNESKVSFFFDYHMGLFVDVDW